MQLGVLLLLAASARAAAVAVTAGEQRSWNQNQKPTEASVLQGLLDHPFLLPKRSYDVLVQRVTEATQKISRRQTTTSLSSLVTQMSTAYAMFESLFPPPKNAPVSRVAEVQEAVSKEYPGALNRKIRYGPYRVPPLSEKNLESVFLNSPGIGNTYKFNARKPCDYECTLLSLDITLEYADGTTAENSNGAWFHHAVLLNAGPNAATPSCYNVPMEVVAMAGNEKSSVVYTLRNSTVKAGYRLNWGDTFFLNTQLMNMEDKEKFVWVAVTYNYLDGPRPDYLRSRMIWNSLTTHSVKDCTGSTVTNPFGATNVTNDLQPLKMRFSEHSIPFQVNVDGFLLASAGHMHDGGTDIDVFNNDKIICTSKATYSKMAQGMGGHSHKLRRRQIRGSGKKNVDIEHINGQSQCEWPAGLPISKTDKMFIRANYDFEKHPGMENAKGELEEIMGIVGTLVAVRN